MSELDFLDTVSEAAPSYSSVPRDILVEEEEEQEHRPNPLRLVGPLPLDADAGERDDILPGYSRGVRSRHGDEPQTHRLRPAVEHIFTHKNKKDKPWITLKLKSWASSNKTLPSYLEGQEIGGDILLDLDKVDNIQAIVVTIQGSILVAGLEPKSFYEKKVTLWELSMGDPRSPTPPDALWKDPHSGKLVGQYSWPFSILLPKEVTLDSRFSNEWGLPEVVQLPPTFSEKGSFTFIQYDLTVTVKRVGMFRQNTKLGTQFGYVPRSRPELPSEMRQEAYRNNTLLPGPDADPLGWRVFPAMDIQGVLFNTLTAQVQVSLALAAPPEYGRGSIIPCILKLEGNDIQALDLLSNPKSPVVQLRRKLNSRAGADALGPTTFSGADTANLIQTAKWMQAEERLTGVVNSTVRTLHGEIAVPRDLKPSFSFGQFYLRYYVVLAGFKATGFLASEEKTFQTPVTITSDDAPGPTPRSYIP